MKHNTIIELRRSLNNLDSSDIERLSDYYGIHGNVSELTEALALEMVETRKGTFPVDPLEETMNSVEVLGRHGYTSVKTPDGNLTVLGKGAFGTVVLYEKDGERVAVKFISIPPSITKHGSKEKAFKLLQREITVMKRVSNRSSGGCRQYLACLYDFLTSSEHWMIVMEYIEGTELKSAGVTSWSLGEKLAVIGQIMEGVKQIHDARSAHWDLKPANVMVLPSGSVKIVDFGLGCIEGIMGGDDNLTAALEQSCDNYSRQFSGTPYYLSPESWNRNTVNPKARDIFALGVTMYWMLSNEKPLFLNRDSIINGRHVSITAGLTAAGISMENAELLGSLIDRMVEYNPANRPTIDMCINTLTGIQHSIG